MTSSHGSRYKQSRLAFTPLALTLILTAKLPNFQNEDLLVWGLWQVPCLQDPRRGRWRGRVLGSGALASSLEDSHDLHGQPLITPATTYRRWQIYRGVINGTRLESHWNLREWDSPRDLLETERKGDVAASITARTPGHLEMAVRSGWSRLGWESGWNRPGLGYHLSLCLFYWLGREIRSRLFLPWNSLNQFNSGFLSLTKSMSVSWIYCCLAFLLRIVPDVSEEERDSLETCIQKSYNVLK